MADEVREFCARLNLKYSEEMTAYYKSALLLYRQKKNYITDTQRLTRLNCDYNIFRKWFGSVLEASEAVSKDEDLVLYTYVLAEIIKNHARPSMIGTPDRNNIATDFAPLFSLLYFLEDMIAELERRNVPIDIISDTLNGFDTEIDDYYNIYSRPGMRTYVPWFLLFVRGEILRIGRFQFQMTTLTDKIRVYKKGNDVKILTDGEYVHKKGMLFGSAGQNGEDGRFFADIICDYDCVIGYAANEYGECVPEPIALYGYKEVLKTGDKVLSVHIPSGGVLDEQSCEASYKEAKRIFAKCYPEFKYKAIYCSSWMMEKRLKQIIGRQTNITRFADRYYTYPILSDASDVYTYLFNKKEPCSPEKLPENSSLQKAVKKYLEEGFFFYTKSGIII